MSFVTDTLDKMLPPANQINPVWLPGFRILGSLFLLLHFLSMLPDFYSFWGEEALVYPDILDAHTDSLVPTVLDLQRFVNKYIPVGFHAVLIAVASLYVLSLCTLAVGLGVRLSAAIALSAHLVLMYSIELFVYGVDFMTSICLFYMLIFPVGKYYSLDNYFRRRFSAEATDSRFFIALFQAHWSLAYFFSGLAKALGPTWWNGEAIWKSLHSYNQTGLLNPDFWSPYPALLTVVGISTVLLELLYPVGVRIRLLRKPWVLSIILMHLGIGAMLGLYFFSGIMILINLVGFWFPYLHRSDSARAVPVP